MVLVESDPAATAAAGQCLADLPAVQVVRGRVEKVLDGLPGPPAVIVADPPRKGLGRGLAGGSPSRAPSGSSSSPATRRRSPATSPRWPSTATALDALRAFDAFPMTHHVECVATVRRT